MRLLNRTYLPSPLDPSGLERIGNVVGYFIDTVDYNLQKKRQGEGRYERYAITMEGVSAHDFQAFDALVREKGQELLEILDDWLGQHEIKGGHKLSPSESIGLGSEYSILLRKRRLSATSSMAHEQRAPSHSLDFVIRFGGVTNGSTGNARCTCGSCGLGACGRSRGCGAA